MKKIALITGITGQDGSYLAEFLLKKKTNECSSPYEEVEGEGCECGCVHNYKG
jgi:hypothetical protein